MAKITAALVALAVLAATGGASSSSSRAAANPIRKVVTLLQDMQKKVAAEGEKAQALYEKFECYCKGSGDTLEKSIQEADAATAELGPAIEAAQEKKAGLETDVKKHGEDRDAAKAAMAEATAVRQKEKAAFDKFAAEADTNLVALSKAIEAIERGMAGGFLQTSAASVLRKLVNRGVFSDGDRQRVIAFLSAGDSAGYAPQSQEISGILQTIHDEMSNGQAEAAAKEEAAAKAYGELVTAKKKEVAALSASIEEKLARLSETGVEIATMQGELGDSAESLIADKAFLADLEKNCADKKKVHQEEMAMRAEETKTLAETIKILNDDDALTLFKRTLPSTSTSFMQVQATSKSQRVEAADVLAQLRSRLPAGQHAARLDFISLALQGKAVGFEKVLQLIDELVQTLKREQVDDENKRDYCSVQFDQAEDRKKALERSLEDHETSMAAMKKALSGLVEEIAVLTEGITALDKAVAEATEQRKSEHAAYKDLMANNGAAKELILFAKNRLHQFYNPKLFKAAPKTELSREDRIFVNNGGKAPKAKAPGGIAGTGIKLPSFVQLSRGHKVAPAPPPETMEAYTKKAQESNGVMALMDLLVKDLDQEITEAETQEKHDQEAYAQAMQDAKEKRAADSKSLNDKQGSQAELQGLLLETGSSHEATAQEHMANEEFTANLHAECDWLLKYFDVRKQARDDEIDSLGRAKAVLKGADFSLVQRSSSARSRTFLRH